MKNKGFYFIITAVLYMVVLFAITFRYKVIAAEVEEKVDQMEEEIEDYNEIFDEEQQENDVQGLSDTFESISNFQEEDYNGIDVQENKQDYEEYIEEDVEEEEIKDIIRPLKAGSRSLVNTFNSSVFYLFTATYYQTSVGIRYNDINGNQLLHKCLIFQKDKLPPYDLITRYVDLYDYRKLVDYPDLNVYVVYLAYDTDSTVIVDINTKSLHDSISDYLNNYGYPDSNCYWEAPETSPPPTITPTETVTPTPDPEPMPDNGNDEKFYIMMIFSFGLVAGIIAGHFMTGFIK